MINLGGTRLTDSIFISAIDTTTQTFSTIDTPQAVTLDTVVENNGINSLGGGVFEYTQDGKYKVVMFPIFTKTVGATISHFLWLQQDTGAGFVDIADSNSQTDLVGSGGDTRTITFVGIFSFKQGDKMRFMNSTSNTNLQLVTMTPSAGNGPRIPSVIMSIDKLSSIK